MIGVTMVKRGYRVVIEHNVVRAIEIVEGLEGVETADTPLDASTLLSTNYQAHGRLDGHYDFDDLGTAKEFAYLCLDFVRRLIDQTIVRFQDDDYAGEPRQDNDGDRKWPR